MDGLAPCAQHSGLMRHGHRTKGTDVVLIVPFCVPLLVIEGEELLDAIELPARTRRGISFNQPRNEDRCTYPPRAPTFWPAVGFETLGLRRFAFAFKPFGKKIFDCQMLEGPMTWSVELGRMC
jgi:hypothetical protein